MYSRDNLPERGSTEIKDGVYIINLDEYPDIATHWVALYVQNNDVTYSDSFGVEHIPKEIKLSIGNENIKTNIFIKRAYDSTMCRFFCIGFIDFMIAGKTLTEFTNIFYQINLK